MEAKNVDAKKILYLECASGISGDMAVASLLDLGTPEEKAARKEELLAVLESISAEGFKVRIGQVEKSGIAACDFDVVLDEACDNHDHDMEYLYGHLSGGRGEADRHGFCEREHGRSHGRGSCCKGGHAHGYDREGGLRGIGQTHEHAHHHVGGHDHDHEHDHDREHERTHGRAHDRVAACAHIHRNLADVTAIIEASSASPSAKELAVRIFGIVAEAEAEVHGKPVSEVHFHEVGAIDSIVDILAFAVCFDSLDVDEVVVCELAEGRGSVRCQHGVIPVPVPAVLSVAAAHGLPLRVLDVAGELVTPTGAAIAAAVRTRSVLPERFTVKAVGYGAGKRVYDTPGVVRAMLVEEA